MPENNESDLQIPPWKAAEAETSKEQPIKNSDFGSNFVKSLPKVALGLIIGLVVATLFAYLLVWFIPNVFTPWRKSIDPYDINIGFFFLYIGLIFGFSLFSFVISWVIVRLFSNITITATSAVVSFVALFAIFFGIQFNQAAVQREYKLSTEKGREISGAVEEEFRHLCFKVYRPSYKNSDLEGPRVTSIQDRSDCNDDKVTFVYFPPNRLGSEIVITEKLIDREIRSVYKSKVSNKTIAGYDVKIETGEEGYVDKDGVNKLPITYLFTIDQTKIELVWLKGKTSVLNDVEIEKVVASLGE